MSEIAKEVKELTEKLTSFQTTMAKEIATIGVNQQTLMKEADRREGRWVAKIDRVWLTMKEHRQRLLELERNQINFKWMVITASATVVILCATMVSWYAGQDKRNISPLGVLRGVAQAIPK
tara:strand:+ start:1048 stop:1410 length:363 start_codon:yes stop_codon:yes gene_type:complete